MTAIPSVDARILSRPQELSAYYDLRYRVFVREQKVPVVLEFDARDFASPTGTIPVGIFEADILTAAARIIVDGPQRVHIGRVVVDRDARGRGLGRILVGAVESIAAHALLDPMEITFVLDAQMQALAFYETLGYSACGPEFVDAGIPHRTMQKIWRAPVGENASGN